MAYIENPDGTITPLSETLGKNGKVHYSQKSNDDTKFSDSLAKRWAMEKGLIARKRK